MRLEPSLCIRTNGFLNFLNYFCARQPWWGASEPQMDRTMVHFDSRSMIEAAASSADSATAGTRPHSGAHQLAEAAQRVAAEPVAAAMSPIVLAGAVRLIEMAVVALIGMLIYVAYVVPQDGVQWRYF